jgi:hypothetical protein
MAGSSATSTRRGAGPEGVGEGAGALAPTWTAIIVARSSALVIGRRF